MSRRAWDWLVVSAAMVALVWAVLLLHWRVRDDMREWQQAEESGDVNPDPCPVYAAH